MITPSDYELEAWRNIQRFKGRPLSRAMRGTGESFVQNASKVSARASKYLDDHPKARSVIAQGQGSVAKAGHAIGTGTKRAVEAIPNELMDWSGAALNSMRGTVARVSRVALSPARIITLHQKRGHEVLELSDLRRLDLKQIDQVRGKTASWSYPASAAVAGAGAGLLITGSGLAIPVSGGVAAAPSGALIASAVVGDAAAVLALASRCVGHISLHYGYDPEEPTEKLFIMSVVNAGSALSATAKTAALADVSRLTQALVRGKAWRVLDKSIVSQVSKQFAKGFSVRFTKQSLGKVVPIVGIVLGATFNWTTLEAIVDAADIAYRRRFLLEKYPSLAKDESSIEFISDIDEQSDETISILGEIHNAGGPGMED